MKSTLANSPNLMESTMHARLILSLCLSLSLTACGDGLSKRSLARQIDEQLKSHHVCFSLTDNAPEFPVSIELTPFGGDPRKAPLLAGLLKGGFMKAEVQRAKGGLFMEREVLVLNLTDKGQEEKVWDARSGACIGRRGVDEVVNWTEPATTMGVQMTRITYKWRIVDQPGWVNEEDFASVKGMTEPVEAMAMAQKMSDGWKVVDAMEEAQKAMNLMFQ